ncbi:hypothetical protein NMG60_11035549 [Bertholletia excelsa]
MEPERASNQSNGDDHYDIISWFEDVAENAAVVQTQTLGRILELNHGVEYLKRWLGEVDNIHDMEASALESLYTSSVPLAAHADLEPYIQRIADGDTSPLLTQQPITTLSLSSGTTEGKQKYVAFTRHSAKTTLQIFRLAAAYRSRVYPIKEGGRVLEFIYSSKQFKTKGGLTVGTATTHYFASEDPEAVIAGGDYKQSTYCHLLLGLFFSPEVEFIASTFAYSIVQAFRSFEEHWRDLCNDIRHGTLSSKITSPKMRKAVLDILVPNPRLASKIEAVCEELEGGDWFCLVPKLWPNVKYLYSIMTGSMQPYLKKLRHYAGELPLVSADYGSTESWIGVNVDPSSPPENVTFAVVPTFSYFEFIPVYKQSQDSCSATDDFIEGDPVPLSQVKIGQHYEIVLTTFTGLYRYRLGDVVEVAGFHGATPKLNFICRRKLILTVNIDKNTENDLQLVVERGSQILSKARGELERVLRECCREMDASFVDHGYVVSRKANSIGPLELCIVERGTFRKILEHYIGNGAALSQFKTPRCTSNQVLLRILNMCAIKRFRSTAYC